MYSDKLIFICTALAVCTVPAFCQGPESRGPVRSLIEAASVNNQELASLRTRSLEAKGLRRQAGVKPALSLEAGLASGRLLGTAGEEVYSAGVTRTLETGGKRSRRVDLAEVRVAQVEVEYLERLRQLTYEIKVRYADALGEARRLQIFDEILAGNRRALDLTKARVVQGDAAQLEQTLLEVELGRIEAQRAATVGRYESAIADLHRLVGLPADEAVQIGQTSPTGPATRELKSLKTEANSLRPDLRLAHLVEQLGDAELRLVEAEGRPDVSVSARYSKSNSQFDNQYGTTASGSRVFLRDRDDILAISVSIPILTKNRNLGNVEAAQARILGAKQRTRYLEGAIPLEVESAWQRWTAAQKTIAILDTAVLPQAQKNLDVVQQSYQLGQLRLLDVLNEQRRFLDTRFSAVESQSEAAKSFAELERAVGGEIQ